MYVVYSYTTGTCIAWYIRTCPRATPDIHALALGPHLTCLRVTGLRANEYIPGKAQVPMV